MRRFLCAVFAAIMATTTGPGSTADAAKASNLIKVTAYCPCPKCCGKYGWGYTTASGHKIKRGDRFAAAPKTVKFGTKLNIPGYGIVPVLDRGGAIRGNRLDVYFDDHQTALNWGVRYLDVKEVK